MPLSVRPRGGEQCVGCLGNRQCWVCLGQGRLERANGTYEPCARCDGSGHCSTCSPAQAGASPVVNPARPVSDGPPVLHLDAPAEVTLLP